MFFDIQRYVDPLADTWIAQKQLGVAPCVSLLVETLRKIMFRGVARIV